MVALLVSWLPIVAVKPKVKVIKRPSKALKKLQKAHKEFGAMGKVKVGFPVGSNDYPDGTSVIMVAAVHEFGSPDNNIPERSFLRSTVKENRRKYKASARKLMKKVFNGDLTGRKALETMGLILQTDVKQKIVDIDSPALLHREGNPLVDTGHMLESVVYEVE